MPTIPMRELLENPKLRQAVCEKDFLAFAIYYFAHYMSHRLAPFHIEIARKLLGSESRLLLFIIFRGSAKSSMISTMYAIWRIVYQKSHFIIMGSDVSDAAQVQVDSIIYELQGNQRLIQDFGLLYRDTKKSDEISRKKKVSDFVTENDVRVLVRGAGQKVRGQRHRNHRPDLVIIDDPEDTKKSQKVERRDDVQRWIMNEVKGGMAQTHGQLIILGNWVHNDAVVARFSRDPVWDTMKVPIMDHAGNLAWPDRYVLTDAEKIEKDSEKAKKLGRDLIKDEVYISVESLEREHGSLVFRQEFMLEAIDPDSQIIKNEWIKWSEKEEVPNIESLTVRQYCDPAVGQKEENDYTANCIAAFDEKNKKLYIYEGSRGKYPMSGIIRRIASYADQYTGQTTRPRVEAVAAFDYLCQQIERENQGLRVKRLRPTKDKRSRLMACSVYIERGDVIFVRGNKFVEQAVIEMLYFGKEAHDDCMDTVMQAIEEAFIKKKSRIHLRQ